MTTKKTYKIICGAKCFLLTDQIIRRGDMLDNGSYDVTGAIGLRANKFYTKFYRELKPLPKPKPRAKAISIIKSNKFASQLEKKSAQK